MGKIDFENLRIPRSRRQLYYKRYSKRSDDCGKISAKSRRVQRLNFSASIELRRVRTAVHMHPESPPFSRCGNFLAGIR